MEPKEKVGKPFILRLSDIFMVALTVLAIGSMLMVLLGGVVNPTLWSLPSFVILGAPFVFLLNVIVLVYWVIRWRYVWMAITGVFMLFWVWDVGVFVQMRFWTYRNTDISHEIKILSYNVHSFSNYYNRGVSTIDEIFDMIRSEDPDIICFQELSARRLDISSLLPEWPYFANMQGEQTDQGMSDCVVFSKYPLSKEPTIVLDNTTGGALPVDIYIEKDTLRLFNCHLQTTDFNNVNNSRSLTEVLSTDDNEQAIRVTARALNNNFGARSHQADTLATEIALSPHPVVVVGDFNSVPLSYTYRTVKSSLGGDAFRSAGDGYGYTYRPMRALLRIDYVLYDDENYSCIQYNSPDMQLSDHNPVIVTLKRKK